MMRRVFSVALMATLACVFGLSAKAGVTVDVIFQDATVPTGITINAGDVGPGCAFGGFYGRSTPTGRCMNVVMTTTFTGVALGASVMYDSDNGLDVQAIYEWTGLQITKLARCNPPGGVNDTGSQLNSFDCLIAPPNNPPVFAAGTYRIGTIVWNTSATTVGTETIAAYINDLFDGVSAVVNGNLITLTSADIVVGTHILNIVPEPGTASLLGLGLVGLILAGRRSRA